MAGVTTLADRQEPGGGTGTEPGSRGRSVPHALVLGLGVLALGGVAVLSIGVGTGELSFGDAWRLLFSPEQGYETTLVHSMRLPRTVLGILAGAALAVAGALMQALTRNPLADPGIFGVNAGASASVVAGISAFGLSGFTGYVWFGFLGAAIASAATFLLGARSRMPATPMRLALAGTAVNAALTAFTNGFVYFDSASFAQYRSWIVGSLTVPNAAVAWQVAPFVLVGLVLAVSLARPLNALALGEETGKALGSRIQTTRVLGMVAIVILCGSVAAAAGPIAFVGLAVPHLVRFVTGPNYRLLIPYCVVFAPVLLLGADVLGRVLLPNGEVQVSIMTALLGGPAFVLIARRRKLALL